MNTLLSRNALRATLLSIFVLLISMSTCFAEGGGGGGGVGGNGASGPEPQSWAFMLIGFVVLASITLYRKFKQRQKLEH